MLDHTPTAFILAQGPRNESAPAKVSGGITHADKAADEQELAGGNASGSVSQHATWLGPCGQ